MTPEVRQHYLSLYRDVSDQLPGQALPWLRTAREQAIERFEAVGFPTTRHEDWKYTNVAPIERRQFRPDGAAAITLNRSAIEAHDVAGGYLLTFVNGVFSPQASRLATLPSGVQITTLVEALAAHEDRLQAHFDAAAQNGFEALNAALFSDGAFILLPRGAALELPIHLLFVATEADALIQPRNIIIAEADSRATIIEHYVGAPESTYLSNSVTRIVTERGAHVSHIKLGFESAAAFHIAAVSADQPAASRFDSLSIALGGALTRNDIAARLNAEDTHCELNGLYVTAGRQLIDHHTRIDHLKPRGASKEYYKGVLGGKARAVFNGKVIVHKDAQQSDAQQTNKNLLLSDDVEVDTKPQLEIFADDVKCSHGATVGQLDDDQLFYLRSRGMNEKQARDVLTFAFCEEIVSRVENEALRNYVDSAVRARLAATQNQEHA